MSKKVMILILIVEIVLNTILGYNVYITKNKLNESYKKIENQNEIAFYNYCKNIYFIFEDLEHEISKAQGNNNINNEYIKQSIHTSAEKFISVEKMIVKLAKSDKRIDKVVYEGNFLSIGQYFISLMTFTSDKNITFDSEDITILHEIINGTKILGTYGDSGENYNKMLDPEHHPLDEIAKLFKSIGKLCDKGSKKLDTHFKK